MTYSIPLWLSRELVQPSGIDVRPVNPFVWIGFWQHSTKFNTCRNPLRNLALIVAYIIGFMEEWRKANRLMHNIVKKKSCLCMKFSFWYCVITDTRKYGVHEMVKLNTTIRIILPICDKWINQNKNKKIKTKSLITFRRLISCLSKLPCRCKTELCNRDRAMHRDVKPMKINGTR